MTDLKERLAAISRRLKEQYGAQKVILFGSYARGEATEDSDVDILVIAPTSERFFERMATVKRLIRDLRKGLAVAPIVLTEAELDNRLGAGDQFLQEIVKTGVSL